jgi:hypothetical protein
MRVVDQTTGKEIADEGGGRDQAAEG